MSPSRKISFFNAARSAAVASIALAAFSCSPEGSGFIFPSGDVRPPAVLDAGQSARDSYEILFDEAIQPISEAFSVSPENMSAQASANENKIIVALDPPLGPGAPCSLAGEVSDSEGNRTRFLFSFVGYNDHPVKFFINEVQTGKNSSVTAPHRDYIELLALEPGNAGGVVIQWASSVKLMQYVFPPFEVASGEIVVLHCAPEGLETEADEMGSALNESGGIDASPSGRDFWSVEGGIPDEAGIVLVRNRAGDPPIDALFYAPLDKSGAVGSTKLGSLVEDMGAEGLWQLSSAPDWEDAFLWNPSSSRPLFSRRNGEQGVERWYVGDSGTQSPGLLEPRSASRRLKAAKGAAVVK